MHDDGMSVERPAFHRAMSAGTRDHGIATPAIRCRRAKPCPNCSIFGECVADTSKCRAAYCLLLCPRAPGPCALSRAGDGKIQESTLSQLNRIAPSSQEPIRGPDTSEVEPSGYFSFSGGSIVLTHVADWKEHLFEKEFCRREEPSIATMTASIRQQEATPHGSIKRQQNPLPGPRVRRRKRNRIWITRPCWLRSPAMISVNRSRRSNAPMSCLASAFEPNQSFVCCGPVSARSTG